MSLKRTTSLLLVLLAAFAATTILVPANPATAAGKKRPKMPPQPKGFKWCRLQKSQRFLERGSYVKKDQLQPAAHLKALKYRVKKYGYIPGLDLSGVDQKDWNDKSLLSQITTMRFMGKPVQVHEKVKPALMCVERRIQKTCWRDKDSYTPRAVGGLRRGNTIRGGEVSNHLFGIAVDIDPNRNPCCGCVDPWPNHKLCKKEAKSIYERTELPRCWIQAFERYGFYWLGRDELQDTMHFEFLGNPDRVVP